jgi:hypothetical protein
MNKPGNQPPQPSPVRQPVLLGLFTGTSIGAGYLLAGVPNVELMTLIVVLSGVTLGAWQGAVCGAVAMMAYSLGSPLGLPVPLLLGGQVLGLALAGVLGAVSGPAILKAAGSGHRIRAAILAGLLGLAVTLVFDLLTNLAIIGAFAMAPLVVLGGAVPFVLVHTGFNVTIFALLLPGLALRLKGLAESPLRGHGHALVMAAALGCATAGVPAALAQTMDGAPEPGPAVFPDTLVQASPDPALADSTVAGLEPDGPYAAFGWRRGLWEPYAPNVLQWLDWRTSWIPVRDGGLGSSVVILGEGGSGGGPTFERDGVPLGTGHIMADDPWLVSNQGQKVSHSDLGLDLRTGADGTVSLVTDDRTPGRALSIYRGLKGPHESYHRGISLLTPRAAWRVGFEFDESIDNEGYNFSENPDAVFRSETPFPGHAKVRGSRTRMIRNLDDESSLALEYSTGRKTKDSLPAMGAEHQEIWDTGAAATMKSRAGRWLWRGVVHHSGRDVLWGDRGDPTSAGLESRLLETSRDGVALDLVSTAADSDSTVKRTGTSGFTWDRLPTTPLTALSVRFSSWEVRDTGAPWYTDSEASVHGSGRSVHLSGRSGHDLGKVRLHGGLTGSWDSYSGGAPGGAVGFSGGKTSHGWKLELSHARRQPRSDELLTPLERNVNGQELYIQPNSDLQREKTWRLQGVAGTRLLGFDLAVDASARRLQEGITWVEAADSTNIGRWTNGLEMESSRLTGSLGRQGRFLGWARVRLEGTWQSFDEKSGRATLLPPREYLRLELLWENHFFKEDGILQLALISTRRGEMADPWDLTRQTTLPGYTWHDLLLGFRLVGADISLAIRNLTDQRVRLSAGASSPGREMDLRLHWIFYY